MSLERLDLEDIQVKLVLLVSLVRQALLALQVQLVKMALRELQAPQA